VERPTPSRGYRIGIILETLVVLRIVIYLTDLVFAIAKRKVWPLPTALNLIETAIEIALGAYLIWRFRPPDFGWKTFLRDV
jgi:hypothetical protein